MLTVCCHLIVHIYRCLSILNAKQFASSSFLFAFLFFHLVIICNQWFSHVNLLNCAIRLSKYSSKSIIIYQKSSLTLFVFIPLCFCPRFFFPISHRLDAFLFHFAARIEAKIQYKNGCGHLMLFIFIFFQRKKKKQK